MDTLTDKNKKMLMDLIQGNKNVDVDNQRSTLKREKINKPLIYVGAGTCGLGAGAAETINAIKTYLKNKKIDADIMEVGCIGLCAVEPIVDVQMPGKNRVSFQKVTHDRVEGILDQAFSAKYNAKDLLGQIQMGASEKYKDVPDFNKHPFFAKQKRIVLKNCGLINPESIDEYIAFGGYAGLYKTLTKHSGADICDIIEKSG
ncbi:MAG: hypothetical protein RBT13_07200 [Bacteroidales bacterium]|jgi:(2Fe-2S) ferredoxin|nr:hypothetical protein [Bacteroidales bacterium]